MRKVFIGLKNRPAAEVWLFTQALPLVAIVRLAVWFVPARILLRWVATYVDRAGGAEPDLPTAPVVAWAVRAAARRVPKASCLTQALAGQLLLARYCHSSRLQLGAARGEDGSFEAHAWLECDGRVLIGGGNLPRYARFPILFTGQRRGHGFG